MKTLYIEIARGWGEDLIKPKGAPCSDTFMVIILSIYTYENVYVYPYIYMKIFHVTMHMKKEV